MDIKIGGNIEAVDRRCGFLLIGRPQWIIVGGVDVVPQVSAVTPLPVRKSHPTCIKVSAPVAAVIKIRGGSQKPQVQAGGIRILLNSIAIGINVIGLGGQGQAIVEKSLVVESNGRTLVVTVLNDTLLVEIAKAKEVGGFCTATSDRQVIINKVARLKDLIKILFRKNFFRILKNFTLKISKPRSITKKTNYQN